MRRSSLPTIVWHVLFGLVLGVSVMATRGLAVPGEPSGWLDARQYGVSGSKFETKATTSVDSNRIVVKDVGDFQVGQGVMVSRCNIHYTSKNLWGPEEPYSHHRALGDAVEIRGYDGAVGSWIGYVLDIDGAAPLTFRWSDDLTRTWKGKKVPVTYDWQALSQGIEVKFNKRDLQPGNFVTFSAGDQLVTTIEKIEGNTLVLKHPARRAATDAVARHCDGIALQALIDRAIRERKNVFLPTGHYRLAAGLSVRNAAAIVIQGASSVDTVLDITEGQGACLSLQRGTEVTIRNLRMIGHTGFAEAAGSFTTSTGHGFWPCALRPCNAVAISGTERLLVENVHASRMASECFFSGGPFREGDKEPAHYTRTATFLRCSVIDCAANAFNNCDFAEGTNILYCRIDGAGWHTYEGSGRFIKLIGNYVRNAGPVTIGDIPVSWTRAQLAHFEKLGVGQAVVADNVFEGIGRCGGIAICHGPRQVVVANNLFINYNGTAVNASSGTVHWSFPSQNITIAGNIIDLTCAGPRNRWGAAGIVVSASDTIVSNNQVYVRGACDPKVTGIRLVDTAQNVLVHDNLVRNCGNGIIASRAQCSVTKILDPTTFLQKGLPLEWFASHRYRGWNLAWRSGKQPSDVSVVDAFDPETFQFKLREPHAMKVGDAFEAFPPSANWNLHDNTIVGCLKPVVLDSYGSPTSLFKGNVIARGEVAGVKAAIDVRGRFQLIGNHVSGFDEKGSAAISLAAGPLGPTAGSTYRDNVFQRCASVVAESQKGLWDAAKPEGNICADRPDPR